VVVLDTDITFATDIGELWELFRLFTSKQVGMLVLNYTPVKFTDFTTFCWKFTVLTFFACKNLLLGEQSGVIVENQNG